MPRWRSARPLKRERLWPARGRVRSDLRVNCTAAVRRRNEGREACRLLRQPIVAALMLPPQHLSALVLRDSCNWYQRCSHPKRHVRQSLEYSFAIAIVIRAPLLIAIFATLRAKWQNRRRWFGTAVFGLAFAQQSTRSCWSVRRADHVSTPAIPTHTTRTDDFVSPRIRARAVVCLLLQPTRRCFPIRHSGRASRFRHDGVLSLSRWQAVVVMPSRIGRRPRADARRILP